MKKKNTKKKELANVEFGNELGDINASKLFEVSKISKSNKKGKK